MLCGQSTLMGEACGHGVAVTLACRRWSCSECEPLLRAKLAGLIRELDPTHFITLTSCPHGLDSLHERAQWLVKSWPKIRRRLRRKFTARFDFVAVVELTKRGEPHLHIAAADCPVSTGLLTNILSKAMAKLTGAPDVDVRTVYDVAGLAGYLSKAPIHFDGCRRYWTSRGWRVPKADGDEAFTLVDIASAPLPVIERRVIALGHVVQVRTSRRFTTLHPFIVP